MRTTNSLLRISKFSLIVLALILIGTVRPASAHVLKQNHGISGVLHIPPVDSPSAGTPTELGVSFADKKNVFSLTHCRCQAILKLNNKVVQTVPLRPFFKGSTLSSTSIVTFPSVGVYEVSIKGTATDKSFTDFQLEYLVRVASSAANPSAAANIGKGGSVIIIGAGSLIILMLFAYVAISNGPRYKPKK